MMEHMTAEEREEFIRRIRTPLTPQQVKEAMKRGILKSPVLYRMTTGEYRVENGDRAFDLKTDTETKDRKLVVKTKSGFCEIPLDDLTDRFEKMENESA